MLSVLGALGHRLWSGHAIRASPLAGRLSQLELHGATDGRSGCSPPVLGVELDLPIILTTAFVIFGAWRRAARDAAVEAVGEKV